MRLADPIVASDQGSQQNGFRSRKRHIPPGPVLNRSDFPAELVLVGLGRLMPHHLFLGIRVLAFGQSSELLRSDRSLKSPLLGELTLPFAVTLLLTAPVVRFLGRELAGNIRILCRCSAPGASLAVQLALQVPGRAAGRRADSGSVRPAPACKTPVRTHRIVHDGRLAHFLDLAEELPDRVRLAASGSDHEQDVTRKKLLRNEKTWAERPSFDANEDGYTCASRRIKGERGASPGPLVLRPWRFSWLV